MHLKDGKITPCTKAAVKEAKDVLSRTRFVSDQRGGGTLVVEAKDGCRMEIAIGADGKQHAAELFWGMRL